MAEVESWLWRWMPRAFVAEDEDEVAPEAEAADVATDVDAVTGAADMVVAWR